VNSHDDDLAGPVLVRWNDGRMEKATCVEMRSHGLDRKLSCVAFLADMSQDDRVRESPGPLHHGAHEIRTLRVREMTDFLDSPLQPRRAAGGFQHTRIMVRFDHDDVCIEKSLQEAVFNVPEVRGDHEPTPRRT